MFTTTTAPSPQLSDEVPGSLQSPSPLEDTFGHPGRAGAICPGAQRAASGSSASGTAPRRAGSAAALPCGARSPQQRTGPLPAHIHRTAQPGGRLPAPSGEPISRTAQPHHSPVRLPETAQTSPTARLPIPCPGQVPSAAALFLVLLLPVERLPLYPEISLLPSCSSLFICRWLTAGPDLSAAAASTHDPGEGSRTPCPLGGRTRPGSPRTGRIPASCRSPCLPSRSTALPAGRPSAPASPCALLSGRLHPAVPTGRSPSRSPWDPFPQGAASLDGHPPALTHGAAPPPPTLSSRQGRGRARPARSSRPQREKAEEPHPCQLPLTAPPELPGTPPHVPSCPQHSPFERGQRAGGGGARPAQLSPLRSASERRSSRGGGAARARIMEGGLCPGPGLQDHPGRPGWWGEEEEEREGFNPGGLCWASGSGGRDRLGASAGVTGPSGSGWSRTALGHR